MKTFHAAFAVPVILAALAGLDSRSAMAYESGLSSQRGMQRNDSRDSRKSDLRNTRSRQQGQSRLQSGEAKPWEARPWEKQAEEKPWEARPWAQDKSREESRRVGRKARKEREERERQEKKMESANDSGSYKERVSQRRRNQMGSQRYYSTGAR
ncbi:MAG TPA: hypothetical protein VHB01_10835 [Nitrosospira sp.]|nr:hypothetical protein [Nitrosospira sp.]